MCIPASRSCTSEICHMRQHTRSCASLPHHLDVWCSQSSMWVPTEIRRSLSSQTSPQLWQCATTLTATPILQRQVAHALHHSFLLYPLCHNSLFLCASKLHYVTLYLTGASRIAFAFTHSDCSSLSTQSKFAS